MNRKISFSLILHALTACACVEDAHPSVSIPRFFRGVPADCAQRPVIWLRKSWNFHSFRKRFLMVLGWPPRARRCAPWGSCGGAGRRCGTWERRCKNSAGFCKKSAGFCKKSAGFPVAPLHNEKCLQDPPWHLCAAMSTSLRGRAAPPRDLRFLLVFPMVLQGFQQGIPGRRCSGCAGDMRALCFERPARAPAANIQNCSKSAFNTFSYPDFGQGICRFILGPGKI